MRISTEHFVAILVTKNIFINSYKIIENDMILSKLVQNPNKPISNFKMFHLLILKSFQGNFDTLQESIAKRYEQAEKIFKTINL